MARPIIMPKTGMAMMIIMKKLSNHLKQHPDTKLYKFSISELIKTIKHKCLKHQYDKEYKKFKNQDNSLHDIYCPDLSLYMLYADGCIEEYEREQNDRTID